jgi:hypothetical protein
VNNLETSPPIPPEETPLDAPRESSQQTSWWKRAHFGESLGLLGIYALLIAFLSWQSPYFLSVGNFLNIW